MTGERTRYEIAEIKTIRGTESKTIASKQQQGWELVTREDGRLRTTLTFRRPKPEPPWRLWAALAGVGVILAGVITVGALLEDDSTAPKTDPVAASDAEQSSPQPAPKREAESSASADPMTCKTEGFFGDPCKFGQTAIYSDTVRAGEVRLEITVGAPVKFVPSKNASTLYDSPLQPVTVYFPVTVKNKSSEVQDFYFHSQATNAEQGDSSTQSVSDGDVDFQAATGLGELPLGKSFSVKDGWALETFQGVEYSLSIDGLAGYTVKFTR
ncbi:hypothetical protein [Williamsia phyllosphaerae]|uniref:DUF4352 domain-containing protein n=1 Tax=Williamsia phyllosphaerae TaxID=885042 RepID=A0ABQ1UEI6_9NOCA|nr:hypothetical protein [Williamsia phyllosphaerae]GGF16947.1 hypothetical protein GCM10007298_11190 [Williamsia phyllosphaerae]